MNEDERDVDVEMGRGRYEGLTKLLLHVNSYFAMKVSTRLPEQPEEKLDLVNVRTTILQLRSHSTRIHESCELSTG